MQLLFTFILVNLLLLANSFNITECDSTYLRAQSKLNRCLNERSLPNSRILRDKFIRTFLVRNPNVTEQKLFGQKMCDYVKGVRDCQVNYNAELSAECLEDEIRVIEMYSVELLVAVHRYLCHNNMTKLLNIFENDGVRFVYKSSEMRKCAQNVPNINSIRISDDDTEIINAEFCLSLKVGYECVRDVFQSAENSKLKTVLADIYVISRDVVQCDNEDVL